MARAQAFQTSRALFTSTFILQPHFLHLRQASYFASSKSHRLQRSLLGFLFWRQSSLKTCPATFHQQHHSKRCGWLVVNWRRRSNSNFTRRHVEEVRISQRRHDLDNFVEISRRPSFSHEIRKLQIWPTYLEKDFSQLGFVQHQTDLSERDARKK